MAGALGALGCEGDDFSELPRGDGDDRESGLPDESDGTEGGVGFEGFEGNGVREGFLGLEIDTDPIALGGGGIGVGFPGNDGDADNLFADDAVVEEGEIAHSHGAEMVAGLEVADPGPGGLALGDELVPGVGGGFLFNDPVLAGGRHGGGDAGVGRRGRLK